jgi:hypothetical protein
MASTQAAAGSPAAPAQNLDGATFVVLEHLPPTFNEATLNSILKHVPLKGAVLSARVSTKSSYPYGQVHFELKADADAAVKVWDQLPIDGSVITAWAGTMVNVKAQQAAAQQAAPGATQKPPTPQGTNPAAAAPQAQPRPANALSQQTPPSLPGVFASAPETQKPYPLGYMNLNWLVDFINTLDGQPLRSVAMCTIHECLMNAALSMKNDPIMENAVMLFYTRFSAAAWGKAGSSYVDQGVSFELARQVFEVLGLVKKYPSANAKSKKLLLSLVERVVEDVSKVSVTSKALSMNKAIPEVLSSVKNSMTTLRNISDPTGSQNPLEMENAHKSLLSWLRFLFSCLSSQTQQIPFADAIVLEACSENCECAKRLTMNQGFLGDAEIAKIYDMLISFVGLSNRDFGNDLTLVLAALVRENDEAYCQRIVKNLHNGDFMMMRWKVFEALLLAAEHSAGDQCASERRYDFFRRVEAVLLQLREWIRRRHSQLQSVLSLVENAQMCLYDLRCLSGSITGSQQLYTLQFDLTQIFNVLADPQYQLCVHVVAKKNNSDVVFPAVDRDVFEAVAKWIVPRCANIGCTTANPDLKKCSGCKMVFYCSEACQRADWVLHKLQCKDLQKKGANLKRCANPACPSGPSAPLRQCSGCYCVWYCSPQCQDMDWPVHSTVCRELPASQIGLPAPASSVSSTATKKFHVPAIPRQTMTLSYQQ